MPGGVGFPNCPAALPKWNLSRLRPFEPILRNPHLLTILGNFWPRDYDAAPYPMERRLIRTDEDTQVLVQTQQPRRRAARGTSCSSTASKAEAIPATSAAWPGMPSKPDSPPTAFTCAPAEVPRQLCRTLYHAGLTSDLRAFLEQTDAAANRSLPALPDRLFARRKVSLKLPASWERRT